MSFWVVGVKKEGGRAANSRRVKNQIEGRAMGEHGTLNLFLLLSGTLVGFWLLKALRIVKDFVFLVLSLYFLSLFVLAKTGVITIHPEKLQEMYKAVEIWFEAFVDWILTVLRNYSG